MDGSCQIWLRCIKQFGLQIRTDRQTDNYQFKISHFSTRTRRSPTRASPPSACYTSAREGSPAGPWRTGGRPTGEKRDFLRFLKDFLKIWCFFNVCCSVAILRCGKWYFAPVLRIGNTRAVELLHLPVPAIAGKSSLKP